MSRKKALVKHDSGQIDLDVKKIELEEINYNLDSDLDLETNSELIKYEFNMIELPFFTKDRNIEEGKARKYTFSERDKSYMIVSPSGKPGLISNKIPQEFDEKIFYGILKLSKEQNSKEVITDYFTLAKVSGVHYNDLGRVKDSLERLSNSKIELHNLFYDAVAKSRLNGSDEFSILQRKQEYTLKSVLNLSEDKREKYKKYFRNSKILEILVLTLADNVYKNIEHKGFLYFNQKELLEIDNATARKLFILITKWQGWEKKQVIKRSCRFLASRIPLSWEKTNIPGTINVIESAVNQLKKKNLINDFVLSRTKPLTNSYIEFNFGNIRNKVSDYNLRAAGVTTGHEDIIIDAVEDEFLNDKQLNLFADISESELSSILERIPEKHRTPSNIETIKHFTNSGVEYIIAAIEYTKKHCKDNFDAYLSKCLLENWAKGEREKQELEIKKENEEKQKSADDSERLRQSAEHTYNKMKSPELEKMHQEAERSSYYRFVLKDKVEKEEMTRDDALKEASIVLISGKIEKGEL